MTETHPPFLADFVRESEFCTSTGICRKTAQRYRNMPDGLAKLVNTSCAKSATASKVFESI